MPFPRAAALARRVMPIHRLKERNDYETACREAPGRFVDLPGGRCHLRDEGEGSPVVLVHGFLYHSVMWEPVLEPLSREFRALAVDLWGWGYSARQEGRDYDYALYADQIRQLMDELELDRAAFIGQSMGGGTLIRFAVDHPDRVDRLVLVGAASLPNPMPLVGRIFALPLVGELLLTAGGNAVAAKNLRDLWFYDKSRVTPEYTERVVGPQRIRGSTWTVLNILRTLDFGSQEALLEPLAQHEIPTLLVWGREDRAVPVALGEAMHERLPGSELFILDEAGHTPHEEHPERFLERVLPFLRGGNEPPS